MWFDGEFWSGQFQRMFIPQVESYCNFIVDRVLPVFNDIAQEAHADEEAKLKRLEGMLVGDEVDMMSAYETIQKEVIAYAEAMVAIFQTVLNSSLVVLYHMYEQHLFTFHRRQLLHPVEEKNMSVLSFKEVKKRLKNGGVDVTTFQSWQKIQELRLIGNAVKHAEGSSADDLRTLRPDLFIHPLFRDNEEMAWARSISPAIYAPLLGNDLYVTIDDLRLYEEAVIRFWQELGDAIKNDV